MKRMKFKEILSELEELLKEWKKNRKEKDLEVDEWLRTLYSCYSERMRVDNERIWTTGSIFLPLSISAFGLYVTLNNPNFLQTFTLAFGSSILIIAWLFIAENHRSFQQKSEAWMVAIEKTIDIDDRTDNKATGNFRNRILTFKGAVQWMRWGVALLVISFWGFLLIH